jgi:hypothetical protein
MASRIATLNVLLILGIGMVITGCLGSESKEEKAKRLQEALHKNMMHERWAMDMCAGECAGECMVCSNETAKRMKAENKTCKYSEKKCEECFVGKVAKCKGEEEAAEGKKKEAPKGRLLEEAKKEKTVCPCKKFNVKIASDKHKARMAKIKEQKDAAKAEALVVALRKSGHLSAETLGSLASKKKALSEEKDEKKIAKLKEELKKETAKAIKEAQEKKNAEKKEKKEEKEEKKEEKKEETKQLYEVDEDVADDDEEDDDDKKVLQLDLDGMKHLNSQLRNRISRYEQMGNFAMAAMGFAAVAAVVAVVLRRRQQASMQLPLVSDDCE